ncbi:hypothetical protein Dpo_1c01110 [Desulfotignum phosphitoxidans DSM 13687]|uniref:Uncharacterized protein n=1 Tax=Desulfotignum phosphitoxidans DSM 13687 TaxID=1286635 RepID=S0G222_9BACT|nr:hypothetical protein Dpo_1c01110 [Desulfotignum phosphitoxidans DSM 13687]
MSEKEKKKNWLKRLMEWIIRGNEKAAREGNLCPS